jgi:two-component system response regulator PilR (NtrC family)
MKPPLLLLVDDEIGVRESLKMVFGRGYDLIEADSADAAIAQVGEARPDVVLLDILMPRADGLQALQRIKAIHPDCAVIMLTGVNSQQLAAKAIDSGAFDFVGKPFDINDLRQKVARAIESAAKPSR